MKEKIKVKEINLRLGQMQGQQVLGVKALKLHYALNKNRSEYVKHLEPLSVLWLTDEEGDQLRQVIGAGVSYDIKRQCALAKTAGLSEIAEKLQTLDDALEEEVEVETYQITADHLPADIDGFAYNAVAWCIAEPVQASE